GVDKRALKTAASVVMAVLDAGLNTGLELMYDAESGFFDRLMAPPMHRISFVTGRFSFVLAVTVAQGLLIIAAAYLMGVRYATGLLCIALTLLVGALFGAGIATLSIILDRKSTRLNSSHVNISYAVCCLKNKKPVKKSASPASSRRCPCLSDSSRQCYCRPLLRLV